jgi:DNA adenine methylase
MRPLLNYFGGKWNAAPWILSQFPDHGIFVEVFGGAASLMLRKPPARNDVLNDLDDEIYNLYWVMRNQFKALERKLQFTPFARKEFELAYQHSRSPVERARRTIIKSYFGVGDSTFFEGNGFRWSKKVNTSVPRAWANWVDQVHEIHERLRTVQIENMDWRKVLERFDSPETLFYLDPPYIHDTRSHKRGYRLEFTDENHKDLLDGLQDIQGMAIVSCYAHPIYDELRFRGWQSKTEKFNTLNGKMKSETIFINQRAWENQTQMNMEFQT